MLSRMNHLRPVRAAAAAALALLCFSPPALLEPVSAAGSLRYSSRSGGGGGDNDDQQDANRQQTPRGDEEEDGRSSVRVFDDVVPSPLARRALMDFAELHGKEKAWKFDASSSFFGRSSQSSPLERVLDAILTELGDANEYVEYWIRDEHVNVKVHADIDEGVEEYLWPQSSHVLYLEVQQSRIAPTVVFPDRTLGWDAEDVGDAMSGARRNSGGGRVEMISVPAVEGRLLKFDGRAMHGVPRPYDRWITEMLDDGSSDDDADGARRSVPKDYDYDEELVSSSDSNDEDDEKEPTEALEESYQRSVLIFNSWSSLPPNAVLWSDIKHAPPPEAESKLARGSSDVALVRRVNANGEDQYGSNEDDDSDDDDDFDLIDFGSKDLNAAERWGRAQRDGLSLVRRLRGQDNRISEAESTMAAKWGEEFGPGLEGMGAAARGEWKETQIDQGLQREGAPVAADARRRTSLAEMKEAAEEVAGPPPVAPTANVAAKGTPVDGTGGGEVLDVELTGSPYRRLHPFQTVRLRTSSGGGMTAREALGSAHRPTLVVLREDKFD